MDVPGGRTMRMAFEDGMAGMALNRPETRNALDPARNAGMLPVLDALEADERCGALRLLTGKHGDAVLAEAGCAQDEIARLREERVV